MVEGRSLAGLLSLAAYLWMGEDFRQHGVRVFLSHGAALPDLLADAFDVLGRVTRGLNDMGGIMLYLDKLSYVVRVTGATTRDGVWYSLLCPAHKAKSKTSLGIKSGRGGHWT